MVGPMASVLVGPDVDLLAWYDALSEDPPGHRDCRCWMGAASPGHDLLPSVA